MTSPVQLYVYDLSNGLARQLSGQLLGRQVDGIWFVIPRFLGEWSDEVFLKCRHTSIVVFGREMFYGRGIITTAPGQSHVGDYTPLIVSNQSDYWVIVMHFSMANLCRFWIWGRLR